MITTEPQPTREANVVLLPDSLFIRDTETENKYKRDLLADVPFYSLQQFLAELNKNSELVKRYLSLVDKDSFLSRGGQGYDGIVFRLTFGSRDLAIKIDYNIENSADIVKQLMSHCSNLDDKDRREIEELVKNRKISAKNFSGSHRILRQVIGFVLARRINDKFVPTVEGVLSDNEVPVGHVVPFLPGKAMNAYKIENLMWADQSLKGEYLAFTEELATRKIKIDYNTEAENALVEFDNQKKIVRAQLIDLSYYVNFE